MRILHVTPSFYPATYWGGPIYSVLGLCRALPRFPDVTLKVLTTDAASPRWGDSVAVTAFPMRYEPGYEVYFCRRWWCATFSPGLLLRLWVMIRWADVVQLTAVYSSPTIPTLLICRLLGKPVVWSTIGALQRWKGTTKPLLKSIWESICNALIVKGRCILHVTSQQEGVESLQRLPKAEAELIAIGVDSPATLPERRWLPQGRARLLFIGRLHPKKGVENLLRAIKSMDDPTISLAVCGTGESEYVQSLRALVSELALDGQVRFLGHVEGEARAAHFMSADMCLAPSFTENFGIVVIEALAHGVPVIVGKGAPWEEVERRGCGLWVDNSPESLAASIRRMRGMELEAMGRRGREWMRAEFAWEAAAERMLQIHKRQIAEAAHA